MSPAERPHRRLIAAFAAALCLVLPVSACGSRARLSKAEYERRVNDLGNRFSSTLRTVFSSPQLKNPSSLKQAADVIRKGADVIRHAADDLDGLNPPPAADHAHGLLVGGFKQFADDLDGFADDAQAGNLSKMSQFDQAVSTESLPSMMKIKQASDELKALGYQI